MIFLTRYFEISDGYIYNILPSTVIIQGPMQQSLPRFWKGGKQQSCTLKWNHMKWLELSAYLVVEGKHPWVKHLRFQGNCLEFGRVTLSRNDYPEGRWSTCSKEHVLNMYDLPQIATNLLFNPCENHLRWLEFNEILGTCRFLLPNPENNGMFHGVHHKHLENMGKSGP